MSAGLVPPGGSEGESVPASVLASSGCPHLVLLGGSRPSHSTLCLRMAFPSVHPHVFSLLPLIKTPVMGFRAHPDPGYSHLEILIYITTAKMLIPNKVTFMGSVHTSLGKEGAPIQLSAAVMESLSWQFLRFIILVSLLISLLFPLLCPSFYFLPSVTHKAQSM